MNKFIKGILAILILIILAGIIFYKDIPFLQNIFSRHQAPEKEQSSRPSFAFSRTLEVNAIVAKPEEILNKVEVTGEVIPNEFVELKSEINGKIDEIRFSEGQYIRKDQVLVKVNVEELLAQLDKLKITKTLRETQELRQRQLLEREAISQEEYDQALSELKTSSADIFLLETQIKKSIIKAPFSGIIGLRQVSQGAYITPNTIIAPIYSIQPAKVDFSIPGKYSNIIKVGSEVNFSVESSEKIFTGKVYAVEPQIDPNTRTIKLRARCPNPDNVLLPGQFANISLVLDRKKDAIMIPAEALIPELGGTKVYIYKSGKAISLPVEAGIRTDVSVEITKGIAPGDTVITTGILQLRSGMDIKLNI